MLLEYILSPKIQQDPEASTSVHWLQNQPHTESSPILNNTAYDYTTE